MENNEIKGAYGFDVNNAEFYEINAKAVLVATGGAAVFTDLTIRDFQDIKCGIHRSIQEPDMQWESMQVRR